MKISLSHLSSASLSLIIYSDDNMTAAFRRIEKQLENLEVLTADGSTCNDLVSLQVEFFTELHNLHSKSSKRWKLNSSDYRNTLGHQ